MGELLKDKVIVITGGNSGLGKAMAISAALEGAKVVIGCRNSVKGEPTVKEIKEKTSKEAIFIVGDLSKVSACEHLIKETERKYGNIDGLIYYAGILPSSSLLDTDEELFNSVFDLNIRGAFFCSKLVVQNMIKNGNGGSIIHIGSPQAYGGQEDRPAYACSKGALLTLTKHIATNYAKHQIRCNQIKIGWLATPGEVALRAAQGYDLNWLNEMGKKNVPMGRLQENEDFIGASNYLLSDASSQVTATVVNVTGGLTDFI